MTKTDNGVLDNVNEEIISEDYLKDVFTSVEVLDNGVYYCIAAWGNRYYFTPRLGKAKALC